LPLAGRASIACSAKGLLLFRQTAVSMPIKPEMRGFYPSDWPQISRRVRFERAAGICQGCGRPHGTKIRCLPDGRWFDPRRAFGAMAAVGRRAGPISSKPRRSGTPAWSWLRRTSTTTRVTTGGAI
jgi:hypothetical protein